MHYRSVYATPHPSTAHGCTRRKTESVFRPKRNGRSFFRFSSFFELLTVRIGAIIPLESEANGHGRDISGVLLFP